MPKVIEIRNLSKKYLISHQKKGQYKYNALRDVLVQKISMLRNRLLHPLSYHSKSAYREEFWALKDLNLEIQKGERIGVIGRNGAGKTTLLKILSRITEPTTGRILIKGRIASLLEVGTGFHPELTGRENIFLNGAILGMRKNEIKKKFDEIVDFADVEKFLDTPVKRYSSGMYVRLAFAVAAHLEPEILLVDEVLAVGDSLFQKKCLGKMEEVSKSEGRTIFFVSHNMGAITNLCTKTLLLESGKMVTIGKTQEVIQQYQENNKNSKSEVVWNDIEKAPGNENVRLLSVRIMSRGHIPGDIFIDKETIIEIIYENFKVNAILDVSVFLRDVVGACILASVNRASANIVKDDWFGKKRPKGVFKTICILPANFLNDIRYSLDIGITHKTQWEVDAKSVISFDVIETGEMRKEYLGKWVGMIRPKLAWSTEIVNNFDFSGE